MTSISSGCRPTSSRARAARWRPRRRLPGLCGRLGEADLDPAWSSAGGRCAASTAPSGRRAASRAGPARRRRASADRRSPGRRRRTRAPRPGLRLRHRTAVAQRRRRSGAQRVGLEAIGGTRRKMGVAADHGREMRLAERQAAGGSRRARSRGKRLGRVGRIGRRVGRRSIQRQRERRGRGIRRLSCDGAHTLHRFSRITPLADVLASGLHQPVTFANLSFARSTLAGHAMLQNPLVITSTLIVWKPSAHAAKRASSCASKPNCPTAPRNSRTRSRPASG